MNLLIKNNLISISRITILILLLSLDLTVIYSQKSDSILTIIFDLNEIEVSGRRAPTLSSDLGRVVTVVSRDEISKLPVSNINELLQYVGNIDVRQRGPNGVQADLSFRGGTFDQVMILLNGVNITDPQTGHNNLNLPIDLQSIERIEILQGAGARAFGPNAFAGAINFITGSKNRDNISASAAYGMNNYTNLNGNGTLKTDKTTQFIAGSYSKADDYDDIHDTDYKGGNGFYHGIANLGSEKIELQIGYNEKSFGASTFYSYKFPNEYEHLKNVFTSLKLTGGNQIQYTTSVYHRRNQDHFELIHGNPLYRNYHLTEVIGANFNAFYDWSGGRTTIGSDLKNDAIWSNTLGYAMNDTLDIPGEEGGKFTKKYSRANASLYLEHSITKGKSSFSVGVLANSNSGLDWTMDYYPGADYSFRASKSITLFANINSALRMPTFTDMFYKSDGLKRYGNDKLEPEKSINYEAGVKQINQFGSGNALIYLRDGYDLIDWGSFDSDNGNIYARNIADIMAYGVELNYTINLPFLFGKSQPLKQLNISYCYNTQDLKEIESYNSLYALDYLKNKLTVSLTHKIISNLEASWTLLYEERNGSYKLATPELIDYEPYTLFNGRISWVKPKYILYCEANNIFNKEYLDIAGVVQPGLWIKAGIKLNLDL